jgi:Fic family protein
MTQSALRGAALLAGGAREGAICRLVCPNRSRGEAPLPAPARAGAAHLYFESIHPFGDGNGRIGRAIAERFLAQTLGQPTLTALAATILVRRKSYYDALARGTKALAKMGGRRARIHPIRRVDSK